MYNFRLSYFRRDCDRSKCFSRRNRRSGGGSGSEGVCGETEERTLTGREKTDGSCKHCLPIRVAMWPKEQICRSQQGPSVAAWPGRTSESSPVRMGVHMSGHRWWTLSQVTCPLCSLSTLPSNIPFLVALQTLLKGHCCPSEPIRLSVFFLHLPISFSL